MTTQTHAHTTECWWNLSQAAWVCPDPSARTHAKVRPSREHPLVDVRDMVVVHTAMLREFRLAAPAVERVRDGDAKQAGVVDRHLGFLCDLLHHHHAGEDALLWPKLRQRVPATAIALIDEVESQHEQIDASLDAVATARRVWSSTVDQATGRKLATELRSLYSVLKEHLELEERSLLPLAASVLTADEWHAIGEAAVAETPKPDLLLAFGMFAYEGDPTVLADMLATAPALPRLLLPRLAPKVYARRARKVHGTSRP